MLAEQVSWKKKAEPVISSTLPDIPQAEGVGASGSPEVREGEALLVKGVLRFVLSPEELSGPGRLGL